jgi:oligopeptide/dipeptide ABC transporter ATP-binding protein
MHTDSAAPLLQVEGLSQRFAVERDVLGRPSQWLEAVDRVSLDLNRGETLGIVGESGCGKSTLARTILRLSPPSAGRVVFDGVDLATADPATLRRMRARMQIVMQDPFSALNPRRTVGSSIGDGVAGPAARHRVRELLEKVGLSPEDDRRFPNEFSGGQRQRICIARALGPGPELLIADEAVSALDVSVQAQILNLLAGLRQDFGLSFLFISHNLSVVRAFCDRIAVMYLGRIVEIGPTEAIFNDPVHPYTRALISAVPIPVPGRQRAARAQLLPGDVPSPLNPPSGCRFRTRCPHADAGCAAAAPPLDAVGPGRQVACLRLPVLARGPVWPAPRMNEAASC